MFDFLTINDVDVKGKSVFLRVDINSPLDPASKRILDDARIRATEATLKDLREAKVVLGAHQSRPGKYDFTNLEAHTRVLQMYNNGRVKFVEDIDGPKAQEAIKALEPGHILVLTAASPCPARWRKAAAIAPAASLNRCRPYKSAVSSNQPAFA